MARQSKQTVDYFPHNCKHGKTIFILEKKYGNNGYAFWFKLLEELGSSEGHFLDLSDDVVLEFLSAKMMIPTTEMIEMFDLLSKLGNIDKDLWSKKIVWCGNFVENISTVYDKRVVSVPLKPISDDGNEVSDDGKQQSKVKESKEDIESDKSDNKFSHNKYIEELIQSKTRVNHIIGLFFSYKETEFDNNEQANSQLVRHLKPAKALKGYSDEQIEATFKGLDKESNRDINYIWTLETVLKRIEYYK